MAVNMDAFLQLFTQLEKIRSDATSEELKVSESVFCLGHNAPLENTIDSIWTGHITALLWQDVRFDLIAEWEANWTGK